MTPSVTVATPVAGAAATSVVTETVGKPPSAMDRVVGRDDFWHSFQARFPASHTIQRIHSTDELRRAQASRWTTIRAVMSGASARVRMGVTLGLLGVGALALSGEHGLQFVRANLGNEEVYAELMATRIAAAEAQALAEIATAKAQALAEQQAVQEIAFPQKVQSSMKEWKTNDFSHQHAVAQLKNSDPKLYDAILKAIVDTQTNLLPEQLRNLMLLEDQRLYPLFMNIVLNVDSISMRYKNPDSIKTILMIAEYTIPHANSAERQKLRNVLRDIRDSEFVHESLRDEADVLLGQLIDKSFKVPG